MSRITVLVCDDHELVRTGFIELLRNDDFFVIGEAADGMEMVLKYFELKPDVVLADIKMPNLTGFEAARQILKKDPEAKILFVTMYNEEQYVAFSYAAGIKGLLNKDIAKAELMLAIKNIYQGDYYFGPGYTEEKIEALLKKYKFENRSQSRSSEIISAREGAVLEFISEGLMSSEIAERLNVTKKTIDAHRLRIMQKFNLKSLSGLIKFAIEYSNLKKNKYF